MRVDAPRDGVVVAAARALRLALVRLDERREVRVGVAAVGPEHALLRRDVALVVPADQPDQGREDQDQLTRRAALRTPRHRSPPPAPWPAACAARKASSAARSGSPPWAPTARQLIAAAAFAVRSSSVRPKPRKSP